MIMKKFLADEQIIDFHKNFTDNPDFSKNDLDKLLKRKSRLQPEPTEAVVENISGL
jgi:hypothetical protein